jgi:hypothetical protein
MERISFTRRISLWTAIVHELGHAYVATSQTFTVKSISWYHVDFSRTLEQRAASCSRGTTAIDAIMIAHDDGTSEYVPEYLPRLIPVSAGGIAAEHLLTAPATKEALFQPLSTDDDAFLKSILGNPSFSDDLKQLRRLHAQVEHVGGGLPPGKLIEAVNLAANLLHAVMNQLIAEAETLLAQVATQAAADDAAGIPIDFTLDGTRLTELLARISAAATAKAA